MRRLWLGTLGALCLLTVATAEEKKDTAWREPPTVIGQADAVLQAIAGDKQDVLSALAAADRPDPWLVAEVLWLQGAVDAAKRFARATAKTHGNDVKSLVPYLEARKRLPGDAEQHRSLRELYEGGEKLPLDRVLALTTSVEAPQDTVLSCEMRRLRAPALAAGKQREEGHALLRACTEAAKRMGWLRGAAVALYALADSARAVRDLETDEAAVAEIDDLATKRETRRSKAFALHTRAKFLKQVKRDYAGAMELERKELTIYEELGDNGDIAAALINIGSALIGRMAFPEAIDHFERGLAAARKAGHRKWAAHALLNMGLAYYRQNQLDKALALFEESLPLQEAGNNAYALGVTLQNIAGIHWRRQDLARAEAFSRRAAGAFKRAAKPAVAAKTYEGLGVFLVLRGRHAEAEEMLAQAILLGVEAKDAALVARARARQATCLLNIGKPSEADTAIDAAIEFYRSTGNNVELIAAESVKGDVLNALGKFDESQALLEGVVTRQESAGDRRRLAQTLGRLARVQTRRGDIEATLATLDRAIPAAQAVGDLATLSALVVTRGGTLFQLGKPSEAIAAIDQGIQIAQRMGLQGYIDTARYTKAGVLLSMGERAKALKVYRVSLSEARRRKDKTAEAASLAQIANLQGLSGRLTKSLSTYGQVLKIHEASGNAAGVAEALSLIGNCYHRLGRYAKALSHLEAARDKERALGLERQLATTEDRLANVYEYLGDVERMLASQERALSARRRLGDPHQLGISLIHMGNAYNRVGNREEALAHLQQGRDLMRKLAQPQFEAVALSNIAGIRMEQGDLEAAEAGFEEARALHERMGNKEGLAQVYYGLGDLRTRQEKYDQARDFFEQSESVARSSRSTRSQVAALTRMAGLLIHAGEMDEALAVAQRGLRESEVLFGGLADTEGALVRSQFVLLFEFGTVAAVRTEDAEAALTFLEHGRAGSLLDALDQRDSIRWARASLPPALLRLEEAAQEAEAAAKATQERARKRGNRREIREARTLVRAAAERRRDVAARIQRALKQEQDELYFPRRRSLDEVQAALEPDEAMVLYGICGPAAIALVLRDADARVVDLGDSAKVAEVCEALDLTDRGTDPAYAIKSARKLLIDPLALGEDVKRVVVSPEATLSYVPFAALFDATVTLTPSATTHVLLREDAHPTGSGVLSLGDPVYGGSGTAVRRSHRGAVLSPLPATRIEAEKVGTTVLLGDKATETELRAALPKEERLRAVHFACHGLVDEVRPGLSSLALSKDDQSDGFLTALEIRRMEIPADLAVLSACETGKGRVVGGEGLVGLSRAFMFAGAPRVICSLWKVDDEATRALMLEFYRLWNPRAKPGDPERPKGVEGVAGTGLGAAEALKQAQAHVRSQDKWKHPYYWAAWVLWGLPD